MMDHLCLGCARRHGREGGRRRRRWGGELCKCPPLSPTPFHPIMPKPPLMMSEENGMSGGNVIGRIPRALLHPTHVHHPSFPSPSLILTHLYTTPFHKATGREEDGRRASLRGSSGGLCDGWSSQSIAAVAAVCAPLPMRSNTHTRHDLIGETMWARMRGSWGEGGEDRARGEGGTPPPQ